VRGACARLGGYQPGGHGDNDGLDGARAPFFRHKSLQIKDLFIKGLLKTVRQYINYAMGLRGFFS
jgi:hypothetical protein